MLCYVVLRVSPAQTEDPMRGGVSASSWFSCSWCLWSASLELGPIPRAGAGWSPSLSAVGVLTAGVEVTGGAALCWLHWPGPPARANWGLELAQWTPGRRGADPRHRHTSRAVRTPWSVTYGDSIPLSAVSIISDPWSDQHSSHWHGLGKVRCMASLLKL